MRSSFKPALAILALGMAGCGGSDPDVYRVAIDYSALNNLPGTCYASGQVPQNPSVNTNIIEQQRWVIWDGLEEEKFLEIGALQLDLGDALAVSVPNDMRGGDADGKLVFTSERVDNRFSNQSRTYLARVTFDEVGADVKGSIFGKYACTGVGCSTSNPACEGTITFSGKRIETEWRASTTASGM